MSENTFFKWPTDLSRMIATAKAHRNVNDVEKHLFELPADKPRMIATVGVKETGLEASRLGPEKN